MKIRTLGYLGLLVFSLCTRSALGEEASEVVAVFSEADDQYVKARQNRPVGATETYAFFEGVMDKGRRKDASIDSMTFKDVAKLLLLPLRKQGYVYSKDPNNTQLMIAMYFGLTSGLAGSDEIDSSYTTDLGSGLSSEEENGLLRLSMQSQIREQAVRTNASVLGYDRDIHDLAGSMGTARDLRLKDLVSEVEEDRYYVVLKAFDFQELRKTGKPKLLWVTRFSIPARGHLFNQHVAAMADNASKYFGRTTVGLVHSKFGKGKVIVGEPVVVPSPP